MFPHTDSYLTSLSGLPAQSIKVIPQQLMRAIYLCMPNFVQLVNLTHYW